jgi:hypothetical protein
MTPSGMGRDCGLAQIDALPRRRDRPHSRHGADDHDVDDHDVDGHNGSISVTTGRLVFRSFGGCQVRSS